MALPVNFKDDVLASSMDGKRRYNMITNSDGTVSFEDVTTYSQEGSNFGSAQINNTNGAINKINNNVLDTIEEISANTSGGKFAGALALKNVNNSLATKLTNENSETFNFGVLNGVRGFFTNPSRADDCFVPFTKGKSGTFISASTQYGTVFVECGFNPKVVYVILPFSNGDTLAICFRGTKIVSKWMIPQENKTYDIAIGSSSGETGIVNLTDNGFVFRSNSGNTLGVECSFYAGK